MCLYDTFTISKLSPLKKISFVHIICMHMYVFISFSFLFYYLEEHFKDLFLSMLETLHMVLYMLGKHSATSYFLKPFEFGDRRGTNRNGEEEREGPTRVEKGNGKDQQEFRRRGRRSERVEREWGGGGRGSQVAGSKCIVHMWENAIVRLIILHS